METRYPFLLPRGYVDPDGRTHREGVLRLATARDEILVLADPRVKANRAYAAILLLARVVVRLGDLEDDGVTPEVIESLFSADFAHLQGLYRRLNGDGPAEEARTTGEGEGPADAAKRPPGARNAREGEAPAEPA